MPASPTADDAQLRAFAARIGHELRNPLNGLCAALDVLAVCAPADAQAREALDVARRQAQRLVQRMDELLPRSGELPRADA